MIKMDLVHAVVERTGLSKAQAEAAVEATFGRMKSALERGERIELRGFGIFTIRPRKTGVGRNPRTGAEVAIAPGKSIRFRPGKEMAAID
ncbi:MAG: HU family DNA-binding protein [Terriglobales bacterium]